ncbi:hypothetical protein G7059_03775 [Erysipelothrix sp. HDW6A]|uniref:hypothetical protein n=1 Tax=Erysipelothrix sp. HDW6A TaxID=2714928 RepID=UPI00140E2AF8|nr:hypothetical protein [Erysipelothrix sp. HDW6A]QIK57029.1 hypothetical protein G7059_03775 [Erysipelothrix sp. HDW6A]
MITEKMDERMLMIRGRGLLHGFLAICSLIFLKNVATGLFNIQIESVTRTDFAIIFVSMFVVSIYMLINDGISEQVILQTRFIFPILSLLFIAITILEFMNGSSINSLPCISISFNLFIQSTVTTVYSIILWKKYSEIKATSKADY